MKKIKNVKKNIKFKKNFKVIEPVNLYECNFGNNIFVGQFVEIQKGFRINDNNKISSQRFIC